MTKTNTVLSEEQIEALFRCATGGPLLLPLRVEGWHMSLSEGGWFIRHSTGRILMTVEFVEAERQSGKPAIDGNAPARAVVDLLNAVPALCATVRALRARLEESEAHNRVIRERLATADGVYDAKGGYTIHAQTAINRATSDLQSRLSQVEQDRDALRDSASIVAFQAHQIDGRIAESLINGFRTRALELCRQKAAHVTQELTEQSDNPQRDILNYEDYRKGQIQAALELLAELEALT